MDSAIKSKAETCSGFIRA